MIGRISECKGSLVPMFGVIAEFEVRTVKELLRIGMRA